MYDVSILHVQYVSAPDLSSTGCSDLPLHRAYVLTWLYWSESITVSTVSGSVRFIAYFRRLT